MTQGHLKFVAHSPTSFEAAYEARTSGAAARCRELVYAFIAAQGPSGATDQEVERGLGLPGNTCRPRRVELWEAGKVVDLGLRRKTASGRAAVAWVVL